MRRDWNGCSQLKVARPHFLALDLEAGDLNWEMSPA